MRLASAPFVAALLLIAGPSLAQSTASTPSKGVATDQAQTADHAGQTREQLRESLTKAGYTDIRIRPEAYVVHARTPDGSRVVMLVGPDEVEGMVESKNVPKGHGGESGGSANGAAGSGSQTR